MPGTAAPTRTLIFGGTFDPPHRAHIELPQLAARELQCDHILYIPAAVSPLKVSPALPPPTPAIHRLAMLRLALREVPNAEISEIEIDRAQQGGGPSYTIDTVRALRDGDSTKFFLLIGADQALDFHRWRDWQEIQRLATPAVMLREPWSRETFVQALRERYDDAEARQWERWTLNSLPTIEISATEIRRRLHDGRPLTDLVLPQVEAYIRGYHLYANGGEGHGE